MKKQNNQRLQTILLAAIATIFLFGAFGSTFAQDAPKFKVGDRIKNPDHDVPATVVKIEPGWVHVKYDDIVGEYEVMMSSKLILLDANNKPVANDKAAAQNETKATDTKNNQQAAGGNNNGGLKVGDRVKVAVAGLKGDKYLQPCTITAGLKDNQYGIRCDPWKKFSYMDYTALPEWVHPWSGATAAPTLDCSFDVPAETNSKNAAASAQLFKRVIYEQMAAIEKAKLGLQFTVFQMGTPFKNVMTGKGLLKSFVPENAMFYPIKTQFTTCKEGSLDFNHRQTTKENFGCYKDRFGDWVCGADGVPEFIDQQEVPKKQQGKTK